MATRRSLLSSPTAATQRELSPPACEAQRARLFVDLSGWARTGMAAVQGGRAALWLTTIPTDRGGRGSFPGSAMRVAAWLWLGAAPRPDPPRPRCSCGAGADAAGRHFLASCRAQVSRWTAVHHQIVALVAAALRRAPQWGEAVVGRSLDGSGGAHRPDVRATAAATAAVTCGDVSCICRLDLAASTSERLASWWTPPGISSRESFGVPRRGLPDGTPRSVTGTVRTALAMARVMSALGHIRDIPSGACLVGGLRVRLSGSHDLGQVDHRGGTTLQEQGRLLQQLQVKSPCRYGYVGSWWCVGVGFWLH